MSDKEKSSAMRVIFRSLLVLAILVFMAGGGGLLITAYLSIGIDRLFHSSGEPKRKSDILYSEAEEAKRLQQYGKAEEYYRKCIEEEKTEKKKESEMLTGDAYGSLHSIYVAEGRYAETIKNGEICWQFVLKTQERMRRDYPNVPQSNNIGPHYWAVGDVYLAWGRFDLALENFELAGKEFEKMAFKTETGNERAIKQGFSAEGFKKLARQDRELGVAQNNWYLGRYYLQRGEYERAKDTFQESMDNFLKHNLVRGDQGGKSRALLGIAYYYLGDEAKAEELLRGSAEFSFLGRIEEHRKNTDKALKLYQSALHAWPDKEAQEHRTERADALNQLGGFYLRQGNLQESSKAYEEAKSLREATTTATHPEYAVTMRGLAAIAVSRNELTSATLLVRKALDVLDASVVPTHARIAPVLVALASIETLNGHPEEAAKINQRLETLLQDRPLAIWKEDFLWTANFYAGVLEKAGKSPEAAALRQIHDRQKDRR